VEPHPAIVAQGVRAQLSWFLSPDFVNLFPGHASFLKKRLPPILLIRYLWFTFDGFAVVLWLVCMLATSPT
jgi:hypothetical protein